MNRISEPIKPSLSDQNPLHNELLQNKSLRVALVDDEPLARRAMRRALEEMADLEIVSECSNGEEAIKMISTLRPDLIFLDVEMPGITGLQLAQRLNGMDRPYIVFVTAYDRYALDAFKVQAIDYLLKPICEEKVRETMERIINRAREKHWQDVDSRLDSITKLIEQQKQENLNVELERFTIKNNDRIYFVQTSSIDWVQAEGNYATLHSGTAKHLLRIKMNQLEKKLDPKIFFRIHRSSIVNIHSIKELHRYFNGTYMIFLNTGEKLFTSRGYRVNIEKIINQFL